MQNSATSLYSVDTVVKLEQRAINDFAVSADELMQRAGAAVFNVIQHRYAKHKNLLVLCGAGNNAGDGYVVARLAKKAGYPVTVVSLVAPSTLKNEAQLAYQAWTAVANNDAADLSLLDKADIVIDALLGTGLTREVSGDWAKWIAAINKQALPVIAVDVPSGLQANTGAIAGCAIKADVTVCFIGLKQGMYTGQGKDVCGEVVFDNLGLPEAVYSQVETDARLLRALDYRLLPERKASSHKGCFGHVLIVGGNSGMPGAVILAATAALRTGAGLVTIITVPENLVAISTAVPEAMIKTCDKDTVGAVAIKQLFAQPFINDITHVAVGMGLGQDDWSLALLQHCARLHKPLLIDADALNLMAKNMIEIVSPLLLTPHPGEAARLLSAGSPHAGISYSSADIQKDRFQAIRKLHALFQQSENCIIVLKGSGTLIFNGRLIKVCNLGNAAMAAPGMGDVLSGISIALWAQNIALQDAVELAVCLHAMAADNAAAGCSRGLLASDVINALPKVLQ